MEVGSSIFDKRERVKLNLALTFHPSSFNCRSQSSLSCFRNSSAEIAVLLSFIFMYIAAVLDSFEILGVGVGS